MTNKEWLFNLTSEQITSFILDDHSRIVRPTAYEVFCNSTSSKYELQDWLEREHKEVDL